MADEIRATCMLGCTNGQFKLNDQGGTWSPNQLIARGGGPGTVSVGSSEEDIAFGDISPGLILFENIEDPDAADTDAGSWVVLGPKNGSGNMEEYMMLAPGDKSIIRLYPGVTIRAKSIYPATSCELQVTALND